MEVIESNNERVISYYLFVKKRNGEIPEEEYKNNDNYLEIVGDDNKYLEEFEMVPSFFIANDVDDLHDQSLREKNIYTSLDQYLKEYNKEEDKTNTNIKTIRYNINLIDDIIMMINDYKRGIVDCIKILLPKINDYLSTYDINIIKKIHSLLDTNGLLDEKYEII